MNPPESFHAPPFSAVLGTGYRQNMHSPAKPWTPKRWLLASTFSTCQSLPLVYLFYALLQSILTDFQTKKQ
jgi:hypothetical protein